MSYQKNEVSYYPEICDKLRKYISSVASTDISIAFSINKTLPEMVKEIENKLEMPTEFSNDFIPSLQLDILFGIKAENKVELCLVEVKRNKNLSLMNFSQLVGYMQVAKKIKTGILLLVSNWPSVNPLSNEFNNIISLKRLCGSWQVICNTNVEKHEFIAGICNYTIGNGIDWVPLEECGGISSWPSLLHYILPSDPCQQTNP